ncbi:hypothetical protein HYH02_000375 [Chlamydomonas schloesseri]|uniref:Small ribosomal subunit protein uS9c n=1 Tax=Chlamydomonas schloesseri TaxID=2026947 RepID=A0A835WUJ2_9CHLO|nr:hypothetical protein HYH02_000375 [Chlamydomonas schloesseri]|eukprot:KAG2454528.1 hypothetical protein HYH02_000375 [Chlamydomonas schloesseri]
MVRGGVASIGPSSLALAAVLGPWQQQAASCSVSLLRAFASRHIATPAAPGEGSLQQDSAPSATQPESLKLNFSLRPSVLSPLFPAWDQTRQVNQRREHLLALLDAHQQLAEGLRVHRDGAPASAPDSADAEAAFTSAPGGIRAGIARAAQRRARNIKQVASQLRALLDATNSVPRGVAGLPTACPSSAHAPAYCAALEAAMTSTEAGAAGAREFSAVLRGDVSPWSHYAKHFAGRYAGAPQLQPLEVIFSRPDPAEVARHMRRAARDQAALGSSRGGEASSGLAFPATSTAPEPAGPHIDLAGVTHAHGKRKTSAASVQLVPAAGAGAGANITVNGVPLAAYFRDPACREKVLAPLALVGAETAFKVAASVKGGGMMGQAQAIATALARALCVQQPSLGATVGDGGGVGGREEGPLAALTRWDGRVVERKKPGQAGSRRGFQWVKR